MKKTQTVLLMCNFAHQRIEMNFVEVPEMPDDCGHASCALERLSRAIGALKSSARLNALVR